jgi:hypothetical protein
MRRRFSAAEHMLQVYQDMADSLSRQQMEEIQQLREERRQAQNRLAREFIPAPQQQREEQVWHFPEEK